VSTAEVTAEEAGMVYF